MLEGALAHMENARSRAAVQDLADIYDTIRSLDLERYLSLDLAEVRGLDYYSGIVFKIYGGAQGFELGGGGRYDGLLGKFGWDLPAVGFSFTLDRVLPLVEDAGVLAMPDLDAEECAIATEMAPLAELFQQLWRMRHSGRRVRLGRRSSC
jgi:ATP phosphoribosyltransferase regulatory subunit